MHRICKWPAPILVALLSVSHAWGESVSVEIEGVEAEMADAIRANLELQRYTDREVTAAQVRRLFARAEGEIRAALEPFGYYNADVRSRLDREGDEFHVRFTVEPGEPVIVRQSDVRVVGPGADHPEVQAAIAQFSPGEGDRLVHGAYEDSKTAVENALLANGFLDARPLVHRVEVTRATNTAVINATWSTGQRFRLGRVDFSGAPFPDEFMERFIPWGAGEYYTANRLLTMQERLADSGYFATVSVQPDVEDAAEGVVPIEVILIPAKRNAYRASVFYGTDSRAGVSLMYERRWLNRDGHKLRTDTEYSQRLQAATVTYRIPLPGPNDRSYNFGTRFRDEETDTTESRTVRLVANESREWLGFTRVLGVQLTTGSFRVGSERRTSSLLFPEATLSRQRADDQLFPRRGASTSLTLRVAQKGLLSDTSFAQARLDLKWIRSLAEGQRLILRGSLGTTGVADFAELPPELRFFAGGDRSIRGFDYQAVGALNAEGEVIGGKHLAVASAEYEYYFLENWGAAVFVDAGDAFAGDGFTLRAGTGLGLRWRSPVGLVRVDFAKPVAGTLEGADSIRFHVVIGPDL